MTRLLAMYHSDRAAWLVEVKHGFAEALELARDDELQGCWAPMSRDIQRAVWGEMKPSEQARLRRACGA